MITVKITIPSLSDGNCMKQICLFQVKGVGFGTEMLLAGSICLESMAQRCERGQEPPRGCWAAFQPMEGRKPISAVASCVHNTIAEPVSGPSHHQTPFPPSPAHPSLSRSQSSHWCGFPSLRKRKPSTEFGHSLLESFPSVKRRAWEGNRSVIQPDKGTALKSCFTEPEGSEVEARTVTNGE